MHTRSHSPWNSALRAGLTGGAVSVLISLVGMVETFGRRFIISGWLTMGQVLLLAPILFMTYSTLRRAPDRSPRALLLSGALAGLVGGALVTALTFVGHVVNLRAVFANASPELYATLTFGQGYPAGLIVMLLAGPVLGAMVAGVLLLPVRVRQAVVAGVLWVVMVGLLRDLIMTVFNQWTNRAKSFPDWLSWTVGVFGFIANIFGRGIFAPSGLRPLSAVVLLALVGGLRYRRSGKPRVVLSDLEPQEQRRLRTRRLVFASAVLLLLPLVLGIFFAEILDNVGLYILMGLGLNIVVGFAGLLDLGYVAFYAIGAYTMGVLTSPELGFFHLSYWQALPLALVASFCAGLILGLPVLKMRGDYLAIVTLGFGEIVRLLALSDWLRPWLGGTQGIQRIAQPRIGNLVLNSQTELYYLFLAGIGIVAFVAWRLKDSRIGRAWMALREDEDVAKAMGINHVNTKLLAFATGAVFSGLAGTIFAAKLQSVYPHSMNFLVSINVLSLIIIGGMGSIPGVFVGALALVAAPDLLREFAEYRYLVYGAVLVAMMLTRPEGLWPEARRRLELHESEEAQAADALAAAAGTD